MKTVRLGKSALSASRLAYGCWRIAGTWDPAEMNSGSEAAGQRAIMAAFDAGYTLFDHADIYCDGVAEAIFGRVLKEVSGWRDQIVIASKCGIRKRGDPHPGSPYRYDFSAGYILWSCEQSLKRLGVETIDLYQLHRPDYLAEPDEIARAFSQLKQTGKVREFGVSNFRPAQLATLQKACPMPLIVNQVEVSLAKLDCFEDGTLDYCIAEKITPMAWSPLAGGQLGSGAKRLLPSQQAYRPSRIVEALDLIAKARGTIRTVVAIAWLLKHPSLIIPIVGSTNPENIRDAAKATDFELSREEWYQLLGAARSEPLP
jgi:predicted oxidoreductase